jgi:hypothetical protein
LSFKEDGNGFRDETSSEVDKTSVGDKGFKVSVDLSFKVKKTGFKIIELGSKVNTGFKASIKDLDLADKDLDSADKSLDSEEGLDLIDKDLDLEISLDLESSLDFNEDDY